MGRNNGAVPGRLLAVRFSAMGDILMTVPVIDALARRYPDMSVTFVSRPFVGGIFALLPSNVSFMGVNPRDYGGPLGLWRLFRRVSEARPDAVADLHDVIRTKVLRTLFRLSCVRTSHIVKDRRARRRFLRAKVKTPQETSFSRYRDALARLGLDLELSPDRTFTLFPDAVRLSVSLGSPCVGIAPFAAHVGKIYPLDRMEGVVRTLSKEGFKIWLFGGGDSERAVLEEWAGRYDGVESTVGRLGGMAAEAELISRLDAMLTMDSGNMHLAALTGTPVVSVWGATHPMGGFMPWGGGRVIEAAGLNCRPCSIYGSAPCRSGDYMCMESIGERRLTDALREAAGQRRGS